MEAYKHYFSGECAPNPDAHVHWGKTFSVGIFQCLPKASGKGLKKGKVKYRIIGWTREPESVYEKAVQICREMDNGQFPNKKSERIY